MPSSLIEIVQMPNGEIVVRRVDEDNDNDKQSEPLAHIRFSDEAKEFMGDALMEVARAMVHAGIECVSEILEEYSEEELETEATEEPESTTNTRTLH